MKFAAFIMTYERVNILSNTIDKIFSQTLSPEKILIVDNSLSNATKELVQSLSKNNIEYYRVGYNAGPAGAAYYGLKILAEQGYDWIFWGDDDDPPYFDDCCERLLRLATSYPGKCGQVGAVGNLIDKRTGILKRIETEHIKNTNYLEVDNIGGGMCKIINVDLIKSGILPDKDKFFGFEELDYDLKCKAAGFSLIVDSSLFLRYRTKSNRLNFKRKFGNKVEEKDLWREYYSTRNLLLIFAEQRMIGAYILLLLSKAFKIIKGYSYSLSYGTKNAKVLLKAVWDSFVGNLGYVDRTKIIK